MSIASQDVYLNLTTPLSVVGSGGGGGSYPADASFSTINVSSMITTSSITTTDLVNVAVINGRPEVGNGLDIISAGNLNLIPSVDPTFGIYTSGAFLSTPALIVSSINGATPGGGGTVPPNLTLSTLNVSSFAITSSIVTNEITAVASLLIQPAVDINILAGGNAQLASVSLDTTINSARATNIYSSQNINIQAAVSTNMTTQVNKINSLQSTIMNSPATYISSTNVYCDGGEGGGAFVSVTPYSIAFPLGAGIFSSLSAQPGAVGYSWPMFTLEQYQKISTVCGF